RVERGAARVCPAEPVLTPVEEGGYVEEVGSVKVTGQFFSAGSSRQPPVQQRDEMERLELAVACLRVQRSPARVERGAARVCPAEPVPTPVGVVGCAGPTPSQPNRQLTSTPFAC
ncbi:MAG: hypothetical protein ACK53V_16865, partial [Planctomycetota bacterium]